MGTEKGYVWMGFVLAILALIVLWFTSPSQKLQVQGIVLPTGIVSSQQVAPADVMRVGSMPVDARVLGVLHLERHFSVRNQDQEQKQLINKIRELAAAHGGNQVVITVFAHTKVGSMPSALMTWVVRAQIIDSDQPPLTLEPGITMPDSQ